MSEDDYFVEIRTSEIRRGHRAFFCMGLGLGVLLTLFMEFGLAWTTLGNFPNP